MTNNELNLDKYRQAWQRESRRLEASAPLHTEEENLAIIGRGSRKTERRRLPLWITGAAASLLLLIGALWLLTGRGDAPAEMPVRYAEKAPKQDAASPSGSQTAAPNSQPADPSPAAPWIMDESAGPEPLYASDPVPPAAEAPCDTAATNLREHRLTTAPAAYKSPATPEKQAFDQSSKEKTVKKKATNSWVEEQMEELGGNGSEYNPLTGRSSASLMVGSDFGQKRLIGAEVRIERPAHGRLSANRLLTFSYCGKEAEPAMLVSYSVGLSWHPAEALTANVNMGGFAGFEEFDAGLMADIAVGWHLTDHLTAGAGYRRLIPFVNDGSSIWYIAIGYTTK